MHTIYEDDSDVSDSDTAYMNEEAFVRSTRGFSILHGESDGSRPLVWDDVSATEKKKAIEVGIADYKSSVSGELLTAHEVRTLYPGASLLYAHWVNKAKMTSGGLIGRSRWTPKGFMEREAGEVDSPTVNATTERVADALGLRKRWQAFQGDLSSAFFQGQQFKEDEKRL